MNNSAKALILGETILQLPLGKNEIDNMHKQLVDMFTIYVLNVGDYKNVQEAYYTMNKLERVFDVLREVPSDESSEEELVESPSILGKLKNLQHYKIFPKTDKRVSLERELDELTEKGLNIMDSLQPYIKKEVSDEE